MGIIPKRLKRRANPNRWLIDEYIKDVSREIPYGSVVLDAGAGNCRYRHFFEERHVYLPIDFCRVDGKSYKRMALVSDLCNIGLRDSSVDAAICIEVLEHIREPLLLIRELNRVLKPGGVLYLTCPQNYEEHEIPYDYYRFTRYSLADLFEMAGMEVEYIRPKGGFFNLMAMLTTKTPNYLGKDGTSLFSKALYSTAKAVFAQILPLFIQKLDFLDKHKRLTIGYTCKALKKK
jgi:SAM-dependent methyltransferase